MGSEANLQGLDYKTVNTLGSKKLVAHVNYFVLTSVDFLKQFSTITEDKLEKLSVRVQRLVAALTLLETKLGKFIFHYYMLEIFLV